MSSQKRFLPTPPSLNNPGQILWSHNHSKSGTVNNKGKRLGKDNLKQWKI